MHSFIRWTTVLLISLPAMAVSQTREDLKIPDLNPSRVSDADESVRPSFAPIGNADIQKRPPIQANELRGNAGRTVESIQNQNQPMAPPSVTQQSTATRFTNPQSTSSRSTNPLLSAPQFNSPQSTSNGIDQQPLPPVRRSFSQPNQTRNQNPMQEMNPARLQPAFRSSQTQGQLPPITNSNNEVARPMTGQTLPIVRTQATEPSDMTPRIESSINDRSSVMPATFNNPINQTTPNQESTSVEKNILEIYEVSSNNNPLPGVPVSLKDMMQQTPQQFRKAMVQQYWETYFDWATLQNRLQHVSWMNQIQSPRSRSAQMMLQTAKSMAQNEVTAAEIQLSKSQARLQQISRFKNQDLLPLPLNQPLVTKYNSHYDWYASRNLVPTKLKGINEMLPRTHQLIKQRANTVRQAENARNQVRQEFGAGQVSLANLLESGRAWQSSLQGFIGTVVNYNHAISDYALTIASPRKSVDQVVSMLVAKPKSVNQVAQQNSVLQRNSVLQNPQQAQPAQRFAQQPVTNRVSAQTPTNQRFNSSGNSLPSKSGQNFANSGTNLSRTQFSNPPVRQANNSSVQPTAGNSATNNSRPNNSSNLRPRSTGPSQQKNTSFNSKQSSSPAPSNGQSRQNQQLKNRNNGFNPSNSNNNFSGGSGGNFGT